MNVPFHHISLTLREEMFEELSKDELFINKNSKGRKEGVLIDILSNSDSPFIPLVRTTTAYSHPPKTFPSVLYCLIEKIKEESKLSELKFNNAMIESYTSEYKTMSYHSDQALDLKDESYICIFSTYSPSWNEKSPSRILRIQNKETGIISDIRLSHNSCVIFSVETNKRYKHKIILDPHSVNEGVWLGITFRQSKTFIKFENGIPYLIRNDDESLIPSILTLATEEERKEFIVYKGMENKLIDFTYPTITYTISPGDLIQPSSP
jgi:hypothetical protein